MKDMKIALLFDFYKHFLTDKQAEVIDQYYNEDLSLSEISENLGITRQGARDNIKRAEGALLELEEKMGAARRYKQTSEVIDRIRMSASSIRDLARHNSNYRIIDEADAILALLEEAQNNI